ncbi:MAG: MBL fold metallo-hydrolase, partial [Nanoarchaeota archaeon]
HFHHDHVEGLGVSSMPYNPSRKIKVYGRNTREGLEARFNGANFPVPLAALRGIESFNEIQPEFYIGDVKVETLIGNHPHNGSVGYKFTIGNKNIVYATDMEFSYDSKGNTLDDRLKDEYVLFVHKANLLIADAQFTYREYVEENPIKVKGWGHSYAEQIMDMAAKAWVRRVVLTHHAPRRSDIELSFMWHDVNDHCFDNKYDVRFEYARQNCAIKLNSH